MLRKTMNVLLVALLASFAMGAPAEAAAKKAVKPRAKHSTRVASGVAAPAAKKPAPKKPAPKKPAASAKKRVSTKPR